MVKRLVEDNNLHTICTSGNCPNIGECWNSGTATLMILGDICTRSCRFCGTVSGKPLPPDTGEPERVAHAVKTMGLKHCVITSVDRDDLADGGAQHWAETIQRIRDINSNVTVEALIPDFRGDLGAVDTVIDAGPDVISHNIETVRRLTPLIRSVARYEVSLSVLKHISARGITSKSGLMLGLGESEEEVIEALHDLNSAGCSVVTIGQYLAPSLNHIPVVEYVTPDKFEEYRHKAREIGFKFVESSPLVRSSFHAEKHICKERGERSAQQTAVSTTSLTRVIFEDLGVRDYKEVWEYQEKFFNAMVGEKGAGNNKIKKTPDRLLFVEHNHVYTLGKHGSQQNLLLDYLQLKARNASFFHIDRGGDITYHGPGQLVGYPIFDLEGMGMGLREYIRLLEDAIILCVSNYGIESGRLEGATGVWLDPAKTDRARKICAIGVRASRYVTMHGFALNVSTDLSYFDHINPCGFTDKGVTSIEKETGRKVSMSDVKDDMRNAMREVFGYEYY
jgi:lipoic acid synthetase